MKMNNIFWKQGPLLASLLLVRFSGLCMNSTDVNVRAGKIINQQNLAHATSPSSFAEISED